MKILAKIILILILFLLSSPILLLQSCGDKAPYGTSVSVEAIGITYDPINPASDPPNATKTQVYRVTVIGADGLPMNGIKVDVVGTLGTNSVIDSFGSAPPPGTAFNKKTENYGFFDFPVVAHVYRPLTLDPPAITSVVGSTTGGTLAVGANATETFCYQVSAIDAATPIAETGPSTAVCGDIDNSANSSAIATGSVAITWGAVYGANGYRVYRTSATTGIATGQIGSTTALTSTDSGGAVVGPGPTGTGSIVTLQGNNSISGTITVTTGASIGTASMAF